MAPTDPPSAAAVLVAAVLVWGLVTLRLINAAAPLVRVVMEGGRCPH